jgi:hypothetical protein
MRKLTPCPQHINISVFLMSRFFLTAPYKALKAQNLETNHEKIHFTYQYRTDWLEQPEQRTAWRTRTPAV